MWDPYFSFWFYLKDDIESIIIKRDGEPHRGVSQAFVTHEVGDQKEDSGTSGKLEIIVTVNW